MKSPKLLIFGIDGGDPRLIRHGIKNGYLPNLANFSRDSIFKDMRCTWPPHTATGWPSIFSGCLPGEHGIFQFWDCQDKDYKLNPALSHKIGVPQIWDTFKKVGWTLGLVNLPMSHPAGPWDGYQFTWPLTPTLHYSKPPNLAKEISKVGGLGLPDLACLYNGEQNYLDKAKHYIRSRTKGVVHLLRNKPVDVVAVVYPEVDRASHHFWQEFNASTIGNINSSEKKEIIIQETYKEIDNAFGELLSLVGDECTIMVISDHGFGPCDKGIRLHQVLENMNLLKISKHLYNKGENNISETTAKYNALNTLDFEKTLAYIPTPGSYGLNINLKGRQSKGVVKLKDKKSLINDLKSALLEIKDQISKKEVFKNIVVAEECYPGKYCQRAPDLLLVPSDPATYILSGTNGNVWDNPLQTGIHRIEGVCLIRSKVNSALYNENLILIENVKILLLEILGIPSEKALSNNLDLQKYGLDTFAWSNQLDPNLNIPTPETYNTNQKIEKENKIEDSLNENEDIILKRLKELGYID